MPSAALWHPERPGAGGGATPGGEIRVRATNSGGGGHDRQKAAPLVVVDGVTLQYKTTDHLVTATWKVGFEVYESDRYVLLGPSGCGKTTILKAVAGFMAPVAGSITLAGQPI